MMNSNKKRLNIDANETSLENNMTCIPWYGFDKYFKYVEESEENIKVLCLLCLPSRKTKSTSKKSSTNLKRHMKKVHTYKYAEFLADTDVEKKTNCLQSGQDTVTKNLLINDKSSNLIQTTLNRIGTGNEIITQKQLDSAIIKFVVQDTQPINIVDKPVFLNLIRLGLPKTLKTRLNSAANAMVDNITKTLSNIEYISETADCWTQGKKSYLGITAHWINITTLVRESASLVCTVIKSRHTFDVIAQEIYNINIKYKIQNKVTSTTTDNGSNFVKAFRIFGINKNYEENLFDEDQNRDEEIELIDLTDIIENAESSTEIDYVNEVSLSAHRRCVSHTLNLVATNDVEKWFNENERKADVLQLKKLYRKLFAKLTKLWSKQNQSTIVAENIHEVLNVYLRVPNKTRWNSTYDALIQLKRIINEPGGLEKLNHVMDFNTLPRILNKEAVFINEFCDIFGPVAESLDFLQGEKAMYMGYLLPTLHALEKKIKSRQCKPMKYYTLLLEAVLRSLKKRFDHIWMEKDLVIAACLIPRFKLNWLEGEDKLNAELFLKTEFLCSENEVSDGNSAASDSDSDSNKDFFCLPTKSYSNNSKTITSDQELLNFLSNKNIDLKSLFAFPKVLFKFIQFNTGLPSSAPVERLFSTGGNVMTSKRHRLGDDMFENLILIKRNKMF
ncbi:hypothetical protein QTP88_016938 [Uroleucon formosanum]